MGQRLLFLVCALASDAALRGGIGFQPRQRNRLLAIDANTELAAADPDKSGLYLANFVYVPIYSLKFHVDDQVGYRSFFGVVDLAGDVGKVMVVGANDFFSNPLGQFCQTRLESSAECFKLFIG